MDSGGSWFVSGPVALVRAAVGGTEDADCSLTGLIKRLVMSVMVTQATCASVGRMRPMRAIIISWVVSAVLIVVIGGWVGWRVTGHMSGLLIDARGRYSLTHLQVALWTIVIMSVVSGTSVGRICHTLPPLDFDIPGEVLAVMGISLGSGVLTTAAKTNKDATRPESVAASMPKRFLKKTGPTGDERERWRPRLRQIYMQEEGTFADKVVDIGKFQNFLITLVLVVAYIAAVGQALHAAGSAYSFKALPGFGGVFVTLLGISHGAYVAAKVPPQTGSPDTNLRERDEKVRNSAPAAAAQSALGPISELSDANPINSVPSGAARGVVDANRCSSTGVSVQPSRSRMPWRRRRGTNSSSPS